MLLFINTYILRIVFYVWLVMVKRLQYMDKLSKLMNTDDVKIITGVRRSGKTHLIKSFMDELKRSNVPDENIIYISLETGKYRHIQKDTQLDEVIYDLVKNNKGKIYLFFDEIHRVNNWEEAINSYRVDFDSDIYVTGSYARVLGGINRTVLSGRYVTVKIHPFSYKEYLDYYKEKGLTINITTELKLFEEYLIYGGLPGHLKYEGGDEKDDYLLDVYNSIMLNDIFDLEKITSTDLYRKLIEYVVINIGNLFSVNSIKKYLKSEGRNSHPDTIMNYILYATNAYLLYQVKRESIKKKEVLKTLEKYYVVDIGFYNLLISDEFRDRGFILENIVFLELLRRGYEITVGNIAHNEVDFVCKKRRNKIYVQVSESLLDVKSREREFKSLELIQDNYPKYILTMDGYDYSRNGIKHMNILDFLKDENI